MRSEYVKKKGSLLCPCQNDEFLTSNLHFARIHTVYLNRYTTTKPLIVVFFDWHKEEKQLESGYGY